MLYDFRGLETLKERVWERYEKGDVLDKATMAQVHFINSLWDKVGMAMRDAQFDLVIKSLDELKAKNKDLEQVKATVMFYHLPRVYRNIYSKISADKIQQILKSAPGSKAQDYGF